MATAEGVTEGGKERDKGAGVKREGKGAVFDLAQVLRGVLLTSYGLATENAALVSPLSSLQTIDLRGCVRS